jgi:hypothetical protein
MTSSYSKYKVNYDPVVFLIGIRMNLVLRDPNPIGIADSDPVDRKTAKMFCT